LTGADSEVVEESSVANLLAEENRIADLRRYSVDDIYRSNWKRALDEIRELVTLRPYHADYHMTLGLVHRRLEDVIQDGSHLQEAMRKYEEYSEFGGEEAIASLLLAEAHAVNNDRPRAFEFLERAASNGMNIARAVQQFPLLEKYTRDTRFVRTALRLERYTLATVVSRDPFTGPWRIGTEQDETIFIGPFTKQQQQQFLATAREAMARVEYALRNRDEVAAMEAYGQIEEISSTVARFDQPELAGELRSIMERLDEVEDGIEQIRVTYLYEQARSKMASMKKSFEEQDFVMVDRLHGEVCSMAFSIEELGNSYSTAATLVVQAADQLQQRSNIVREFLAKNVTVAGVVVAPEGSHAIIDGHWVPEGGDVFEGRLDQILRDRVVILYKGERIIQKFSRF
jgi:tetratricopeptide (TPR) repeat protein